MDRRWTPPHVAHEPYGRYPGLLSRLAGCCGSGVERVERRAHGGKRHRAGQSGTLDVATPDGRRRGRVPITSASSNNRFDPCSGAERNLTSMSRTPQRSRLLGGCEGPKRIAGAPTGSSGIKHVTTSPSRYSASRGVWIYRNVRGHSRLAVKGDKSRVGESFDAVLRGRAGRLLRHLRGAHKRREVRSGNLGLDAPGKREGSRPCRGIDRPEAKRHAEASPAPLFGPATADRRTAARVRHRRRSRPCSAPRRARRPHPRVQSRSV